MLLNQLFTEKFLTPYYDQRKALALLAARGWQETGPGWYKHPDAPGYSITLDIHHMGGKGPFSVFQGSRNLGQSAYPPYASHLNLRKPDGPVV